ncbi:hypothetical protein [Amycolatopsis sp. lyj-112]|uniref:hypothetical protein n=1 Tax=Amycolatopsis sp. lyj-112 TaxID=2789288 RepID=UPI00397AB9B2
MEFVATALNPTQGLIKGQRLLALLQASTGTEEVLAEFERRITGVPWAVYDVRRTLSPRVDGKNNFARSVRILDIGTPEETRARRARCADMPLTVGDPAFPDDTQPRLWLRHRDRQRLDGGMATAEQVLTLAPATARSKTGPAFPNSNDAGLDSQIEALLQHLGPDEVEQELRDVASRPATTAVPGPPADESSPEEPLPRVLSTSAAHPTIPRRSPQTHESGNDGTRRPGHHDRVGRDLDTRRRNQCPGARRDSQSNDRAGNPGTSTPSLHYYGAWCAAAAFRLHTVEDATQAAEIQRTGGPFPTYND